MQCFQAWGQIWKYLPATCSQIFSYSPQQIGNIAVIGNILRTNILLPSKTWGLVAQIFFLNILTITDMFPCGPIWKYLSAREQVKGKIECLLFVNWGQIFCHEPEGFGRWLNILLRHSRGQIFFTFQNMKAGDTNIWLNFMKNIQYYLFHLMLSH